jgi:hypothetical protein
VAVLNGVSTAIVFFKIFPQRGFNGNTAGGLAGFNRIFRREHVRCKSPR